MFTHSKTIGCTIALLALFTISSLVVSLPAGRLVAQEKSDLATFRRLHDELRQKMAEDLVLATTFLESKIEAEPESEDLNVLRQSLASRLAAEGNFKAANDQFDKLLNYQIVHVEQPRSQYGIWMTIQSMREVANDSGNANALHAAVDRAFESLAAIDAKWLPVSQLAVLKARQFAADNDEDKAELLVYGQLQKLKDANQSDDATEETMRAYVEMLRSLTDEGEDNAIWMDDCVKRISRVVALAIEKYPESIPLQTAYADTQLMRITRWDQDDPEAADKLIDDAMKTLDPISGKNAAVRAALKRIELHKMEMSSVKPKESLVGKTAPEWDIDEWVNTIAMERDDVEGKVVLLDFWAMWCGPCIATFPHLREWREEFGDEKFEIVGVTTYYNFKWDDEKERATRSKDDVSADEERRTIASFLDHHQLKHPVIVTPEGSQMNSQYGVRGIPHVVLIDSNGIVQLVKTGAGEKTAKAIHAKIKELLQQRG